MLDDETEDTHRIPLRNNLVLHQITFTHALRCHLRRQTALPEVQTFLGESVARELTVYKNLPAGLVLRMGSLLRQARNEGMLDSFRWAAINENLTVLTNVQGACERIKNTPLPRQFDYLPSVLVNAFCWLLPLVLVEDLGLMTPIASVLISFTFIAADLMSREISNPFENTIHDIPMTALSRTIELNLREQMEEINRERGWQGSTKHRRLRPVSDVLPVDGFVF
jgi:putative membrane protein